MYIKTQAQQTVGKTVKSSQKTFHIAQYLGSY